MNETATANPLLQREVLVHALYEAAELEHNLMCTYLYAAASLKDAADEGLSAAEAAATGRWKQALLSVAIEEMGHLAAVWNITSALGASPRVGRTNFPLDPGYLPASVVVKLAPFNEHTLQHFIFLERPHGSNEHEGEGYFYERSYVRGGGGARLTPMGINYDTVGDFYAALGEGLRAFAARYGEANTFIGDPGLQLTDAEVNIAGAKVVRCLNTALAAFHAIVLQGEGAPRHSDDSHYQKFIEVRAELATLRERNRAFQPAFPAATNPVLRRPPRPEGRVWLEDPTAVATVDLANAAYGLMLRLLAYAYGLRGPSAEKSLVVELAIGLMRAVLPLAERAARLPAGPSNPQCHAGMSFTALRDAGALPPGRAARLFFSERFAQFAAAGAELAASGDARARAAATTLAALARRAADGLALDPPPAALAGAQPAAPAAAAPAPADGPPAPESAGEGVEVIRGEQLDLIYEGRRCIHSRFCVTLAPRVFLANVQGPWIHPDAVPLERLVAVAEQCPSGAIRYHRRDGHPDEAAPEVNLAGLREAGPYAFHAALEIDGKPAGFRATLCRCGASKHKPYCDGSHHEVGFAASGEPASTRTDALAKRDGVLAVDPQPDGPLKVSGNLEIISGTGRVVARVTSAYLCRCGGSATKPFCDGTHRRIGFKSG
jgi:CDGSH-type Zn-finger protein/uncharacterized Fe-S cluster protein YjdI